MNAGKFMVTGATMLAAFVAAAIAQPEALGPARVKPFALSLDEEKAVDACLQIIRGCQLPDGAFRQRDHGDDPSAPVWVAPYFANYAALALLAGHAWKENPADLGRVGQWLEWCAKNQSADGYWNDFAGTAAHYVNNGEIDAWDSSAAMFLAVAGRYGRAARELPPPVRTAVSGALRCIEGLSDRDGLTWVSPTYKIKYLMDNIEVQAGLQAAAEFFAAIGAGGEGEKARARAQLIRQRLPDYWRPAEKLFAYALDEHGRFEGGLQKLYPQGLAQLFGVSFVEAKAEAWALTVKQFSPDRGPTAVAGAERWLAAAVRLKGAEVSEWRAKVVADVASFRTDNVYLHRPAVAALTLLEGADWMPSAVRTN